LNREAAGESPSASSGLRLTRVDPSLRLRMTDATRGHNAIRILGRKTDIMTRDSIHKLLIQQIETTAVPVFGYSTVASTL
jgi:hypothetical protein